MYIKQQTTVCAINAENEDIKDKVLEGRGGGSSFHISHHRVRR